MPNNLFSLFDDKLKTQRDLIAVPPQSLESISSKEEEQEYVLRKIRQFEDVRPKVDYSDFSNFVFFNSALDYFNITGEKILNEYPYDGTLESTEAYLDDLDDYQKYVVGIWPKWNGHLRFDPSVSASYVSVEDQGQTDGVTRSILSPGTGSWTMEMWCIPPPALTGSNDVMVAMQKVSGTNGDGYSMYFSGSKVTMRLVSGSAAEEISAQVVPGQTTYVCGVIDRSTTTLPVLSIITGTVGTFPVLVTQASSFISGNIILGSSKFSIGSGTIPSKVTRPMTGSMDGVRLWQVPLSLDEISGTFNAKVFAQKNLQAAYRFNEKGSVFPTSGSNPAGENAIVLDHSGHKLNGRIQSYFANIRGSGSLTPFEDPDLILQINATEVQSYILDQQTSGSTYDRDNDNIISRLLPDQFFVLEQFKDTDVLVNFLYILARNFDYIKVRIDQFVKVTRNNYTDFDGTPDALLQDIARFFGWEFTGNFLNADAFQYILGKNVLGGVQDNKSLDTKLFEVKNQFWKRLLINLMYIYKTKGTRESVESMLRIYGVNKNIVRLKEYGYKPNVGIQTHRISSEKSAFGMVFTSASVGSFPVGFPILMVGSTFQSSVTSPVMSSSYQSIETRVRFPISTTTDNYPVLTTGSIWTLQSGSTALYQLYWTKADAQSITGTLFITGTDGQVSLGPTPIFNDGWYNIAFIRNPASGTIKLDVKHIYEGDVDYSVTASMGTTLTSASIPVTFILGATGSFESQMWAQEARVWNRPLDDAELIDHALNFQSYGSDIVNGSDDLRLHWRLNENVTASSDTTLPAPAATDVSTNGNTGAGFGFQPSIAPYKKFLNEYNYIASPDFGWNEDKIRVLEDTKVKPRDAFVDNQTLALEFNMVDALNEDISQIIATMDNFNNFIGLPVNRYRATYQDLVALRRSYFKRLQGRLNFRVFSDMLEFFDHSFVDMVRRLIPARATFLGEEFVVESHMLERPKLQWNYRRQEVPFQPEGTIKVYIRT